jgi:hypothetical protein
MLYPDFLGVQHNYANLIESSMNFGTKRLQPDLLFCVRFLMQYQVSPNIDHFPLTTGSLNQAVESHTE